jgi:hypothetical protein
VREGSAVRPLLSGRCPRGGPKSLVEIAFEQLLKADDPPRTGSYTRTVTFTRSTTQP